MRTVGNQGVLLIEVREEGGAVMPTIALCPKIKFSRLDVWVQLREVAKKTLQNVPSGDGRELSSVYRGGIDDRVISHEEGRIALESVGVCDMSTCIFDSTRRSILTFVETSNSFAAIREAYTQRLRNEQQIRNFIPSVWI